MTVPGLSQRTLDALEQAKPKALSEVLTALGDKAGGRTGGMLRMFIAVNSDDGPKGWRRLYESRVGEQADEEDWQKYEFISMEKFLRLAKTYAQLGYVSSWQSRNVNAWEYGGAFIVRFHLHDANFGDGMCTLLVAFSGLPEIADEAFVLKVLQKIGWGSMDQYAGLLNYSNNEFASELLMAAA